MSQLQWDVRVARSPEPAAHAIVLATRALDAGDRTGAEQGYRDVQRQGLLHAASWSNLAALGIGLGDAAGARAHARRALELDRGNADAWVNFGVASWLLRQRRDAAQAMHRALERMPGLEAAALNYARMQQAVGRGEQGLQVLRAASGHAPDSWKLALARAEQARLQSLHGEVREAILQALRRLATVIDTTMPGSSGLRPAAGTDVGVVLHEVGGELEALGIRYHLAAGTLLGIVKDGRPFPHDKDVDLILPDLADEARQRILAHFDAHTGYRLFPPPPPPSPVTVIGLQHVGSGIGADLILPRRLADGRMCNEMGWPDQLSSVLRAYEIGTLRWDGRDWPVPEPLEGYLSDVYGSDWREQRRVDAGVEYDRCYSDTMVSNPSRTTESLPRAVNLGLIRLAHALRSHAWAQAVAYCAQLLAREELPEVRRLLAKLQAAGHTGLRFDG
ncbi:MAG TPA: LicD family protein [Thermomonas sp.]|nr:LicD family protein [Thermomonas sp.]